MNGVVVHCGLFVGCGKCSGELLEKFEQGLAEASVGFEEDGCYGLWVVLGEFVDFAQCVGVARGHSDVSGTRQGSCCCGGGNHNVKVTGGIGGEKCDVGSVVLNVVFVWVFGLVGVGDDVLFGEWGLSCDLVDDVG